MSTYLMDQGIKKWQEGKELEQKKEYREAIDLYKQGCEFMFKWIKYDNLEVRKKELMNQINKYIDHIEQLKKLVDQPVKQPSTNQGGSSDNNKENNELQDAIKQCILIEKPTTTFADVAGLETIKQLLLEAVVLPKKFPNLFSKERRPARNILLYGTPGTGKTFLAQCLAAEVNSTFFSVSSSDLVSKWQGESERLIKALFELARNEKDGSIVFIDEIDSLLSARGTEGENEASRRIKTEFLVQLQGVGHNNDNILVLGATNYPENIDPAIRRRFEKRIEIPLPEPEARRQILMGSVKNTENTITQQQFDDMVQKTDGYSASDLKNLMKDAIMMPVRELSSCTWWRDDENGMTVQARQGEPGAYNSTLLKLDGKKLQVPPVTYQHLLKALKNTKKTVGEDDKKRIKKFTQEYGQEG